MDTALDERIAHARKPLLIIGLGARHDADAAAIRGLCERRHVPAMVTYKAKGVVPDAHTSFAGPIRAIRTAAKDPLFFLLHCNVDRLWAVWQRQNGRYNIADGDTYQPAPLAGHRIGHNLGDTMWPWNGNVTFPRPNFPPPGGTMAPSPCVEKPGLQPQVQQCFDYQGTINIANNLGFSYDDVPL